MQALKSGKYMKNIISIFETRPQTIKVIIIDKVFRGLGEKPETGV